MDTVLGSTGDTGESAFVVALPCASDVFLWACK